MKKNSEDFEYIGYFSEIDCRQSLYRKITTIFFSNDRNIIAADHRSRADWKEVEEDSVFHELYQSVCKKDVLTHALMLKKSNAPGAELSSRGASGLAAFDCKL